jgi:hypothetical protein
VEEFRLLSVQMAVLERFSMKIAVAEEEFGVLSVQMAVSERLL